MYVVKKLTLIIVACVGLAISGCGGSSDSSTEPTASAESTGAPISESSAATRKPKPKVVVPSGAPPTQLEVKDLEEGSGAEAEDGDKVTVKYVAVKYRADEEFYSSWDEGESFSFTLGAGEVIPGWEQGMEGMKVGGRRELIIPSELAYGKKGATRIQPNEPLVFVVDLLEVG